VTEEDSRILALVPAYNEETRLAGVVAGTIQHLPVLVVDDGSTDATAVVAQGAGASVVIQEPNQGKGAALQAGFRRAIDQEYQAVVTLDADGQHDPAEIPKFLTAFRSSGAELIIGRRDFSQMPPVRRLANWLGGLAFSWALGQRVPDNQSGYRLIGQRLMQAMLDSQEQGFEYEVEMIAVCVRHGFDLDWVPLRRRVKPHQAAATRSGFCANYLENKTRKEYRCLKKTCL
jgi:glycosyltransferase involved in cell wall biosynthesis